MEVKDILLLIVLALQLAWVCLEVWREMPFEGRKRSPDDRRNEP